MLFDPSKSLTNLHNQTKQRPHARESCQRRGGGSSSRELVLPSTANKHSRHAVHRLIIPAGTNSSGRNSTPPPRAILAHMLRNMAS